MKFSLSLAMAPPDELLALARAGEEAGWDAIALPDSVFYPKEVSADYPYTQDGKRFWGGDMPFTDPFVAMPAIAAVTERVPLYTNVYKVVLRQPLLVAKMLGSMAAMFEGRIGIGLGLSWIPEEFTWLGEEMRTARQAARRDDRHPARHAPTRLGRVPRRPVRLRQADDEPRAAPAGADLRGWPLRRGDAPGRDPWRRLDRGQRRSRRHRRPRDPTARPARRRRPRPGRLRGEAHAARARHRRGDGQGARPGRHRRHHGAVAVPRPGAPTRSPRRSSTSSASPKRSSRRSGAEFGSGGRARSTRAAPIRSGGR